MMATQVRIKPLWAGVGGSILGGAGGILTSWLLARLFLQLVPPRPGSFDDLAFWLVAIMVFYPLGAGTGAAMALRRYSRQGMIWKAILAAFAGELAVMLFAEPLRLNSNTALLMTALFTLPIVGILLAYWFNQRREEGTP